MIRAATCAVLAIGFAMAAEDVARKPADDGYQLVWADEFNVDGPPDPAAWVPEQGFVRNHELQWYQPANAQCRNGLLVIEARREAVPNPRYDASSGDWRRKRERSEITSASLTTSGKHSWLYGRIEIRARVPTAPGTWPALWTLGSAREWPGCGEVDIMEAYKGALKANLAWGTDRRWTAHWAGKSIPIAEFGKDWGGRFHVWREEWTPERISLSVDDRLVNRVELAHAKNPDGSSPFREPHYLLLNLAIGGDAAGDVGDTAFPQHMEIDYVRVFQPKP